MISCRRCVPRMFSRCDEAISLMQSSGEEVSLQAKASVSTTLQMTVTAMKRCTLSLLIPSCLYSAVLLCRLTCLTDWEMGLRMVSPGCRMRLKDPHYCSSPYVPVVCWNRGQFLHEQQPQKRQGQSSLKGMQQWPISETRLGKQGGYSQM